MADRLTIKDTVQQWISKINDMLELGTVDGSFALGTIDGLDITFTGGNVRSGSEFVSIPGRTLTLGASKVYVVGVNVSSELLEAYETVAVPVSDFIPVWRVQTSNTAVSVTEDYRTWAFDDAGVAEDLLAQHVSETDPHEQYGFKEDVDKRTIFVGSIAELENLTLSTGVNVYLTQEYRAGSGIIKTGTPPNDPRKGVYVTIANGNYWQRDIDGPWNPQWFDINPSSADNSPAWADMLALKPAHVHFAKGGDYKFLSETNHDTDISISAAPGVVFDCSDPAFVGGHWTKFTGSFPQIESLGTNAVKGERTVTFSSAPSLAPGDVFVIYNPTPSSWSGFRTSYTAGEFCRVVKITSNTVTLAGELYDDYTSTAVDVYRLDGIRVNLSEFELKGNISGSLLNMEFCRDSLVNGVKGYHKNNSILSVVRCFNTVVLNPSMHNEGDGGDDYGIAIGNSQTIKVIGGDVYSRRHATATGGDAQVGSVPCRDIRFTSMTLSNDIDSGTHTADFHGNTEDSTYENCEIHGGATWQGKNNGYVNCRIGHLNSGVCIYPGEAVGGTLFARGCTFKTIVVPNNRGIVYAVTKAETSETTTFELKDCKVVGRNQSSVFTFMLRYDNDAATEKVNIEVNGLEIDSDDYSAVVYTRVFNGGVASSDYMVVDNVRDINGITGKSLIAHSGGSYVSFPHKLQKQSGSQTITTTTTSPTIAGEAVVYKWKYPRTPVVTTGRNNKGYVGNRIGIPFAINVDTEGLIPYLGTDDATNFSAVDEVDLHWTASIDEV